MTESEKRGSELRIQAKTIVYDFMKSTDFCAPGSEGMRQAEISRQCGLEWGDYKNSTASQQQWWTVGLLREMESEGKVERIRESGPWRLK